MNVIGNAIEYSPTKGTVYVEVQKQDGFLQIAITDEGSGFTPEERLHAQEQFFIIKRHDGQLILKNSDKTKGAQVVIRLPYYRR